MPLKIILRRIFFNCMSMRKTKQKMLIKKIIIIKEHLQQISYDWGKVSERDC